MRLLWFLCTGCNAILGVHRFDAGSTNDDMRIIDAPVDDAKPPCDLTAPFAAPIAVTELNTTSYEAVADISADELTLYVASDRARPGNGSELFYTTRASTTAMWTTPLTPFYTTHPPWDDITVAIAPDGMSGVVSSNRILSGGVGSEHLWLITRAGAGFVDNSTMAPNLNSSGSDATPRFSRDGSTFYFDSQRSPFNSRDLYFAPILPGSFGTPQKITELSTDGVLEAGATLTADELTMYFLVTADIYMATRASEATPFGARVPVTPLNTSRAELPGVITNDGCTIYVNRDDPVEGMNVYVATRPPL